MKKRKLKVYSGTQVKEGVRAISYKKIPRIVLQGEWVKKAGFEAGDEITVKVEHGRIIIEKE